LGERLKGAITPQISSDRRAHPPRLSGGYRYEPYPRPVQPWKRSSASPEVLSNEVPFPSGKLLGDVDCTLALDAAIKFETA